MFDFDHQRRGQKIKCISLLIHRRSSLSKIWEEICHSLKSFHWDRLTPRELKVFNALTEGHSQNINPYDGRNYFEDDKAFLQYMRGEKGKSRLVPS